MYVCTCSVWYYPPCAVDMAEVQDVPAGRTYCMSPWLHCSAPACFFLPRVPIRQAARPLQSRQGCSPKPARVQNAEVQTGHRVQSAGCRMQTVQRSIVSDGRFDRLEVPEWASQPGG